MLCCCWALALLVACMENLREGLQAKDLWGDNFPHTPPLVKKRKKHFNDKQFCVELML
jgi:hypothetical protein